jgi:hypothetical protein
MGPGPGPFPNRGIYPLHQPHLEDWQKGKKPHPPQPLGKLKKETVWGFGFPSGSVLATGLINIQGVYKMYTAKQKRYYSPQFSALSAISVRGLAWRLGISMPKAVDQMVGLLPSLFSPGVVCLACKDSTKCQNCAFYQQPNAAENAALAV